MMTVAGHPRPGHRCPVRAIGRTAAALAATRSGDRDARRIHGRGLAYVGAGPCSRNAVRVRAEGRPEMQDIVYLGLIVGFLALSWGLVELCDRL